MDFSAPDLLEHCFKAHVTLYSPKMLGWRLTLSNAEEQDSRDEFSNYVFVNEHVHN